MSFDSDFEEQKVENERQLTEIEEEKQKRKQAKADQKKHHRTDSLLGKAGSRVADEFHDFVNIGVDDKQVKQAKKRVDM